MTDTGQIPDLEEIGHRLAIEDVLTKHCHGVDRADEAVLKSAYWPDAQVAYGSFNGSAHEFCAILPASITKYAATSHRVTNVSVERRGDEAVVESYVTAYHYSAVDDGPDTELTYIGRYVDHMQKRGDCWKISFRKVVMDWNQNLTASAVLDRPPFDGLARSARAPDDPLHDMRKTVFGEK